MIRSAPLNKIIETRQPIPLSALLASAAVGAGLMYRLDPDRGARRRAMTRDQVVHPASVSREASHSAARDLANCTTDLLHKAMRLSRTERVLPDIGVRRILIQLPNRKA